MQRATHSICKQSMGVARSYRGYSSDCHLNIVSCLLTRRLTKVGGVTGTPGPPLATPMQRQLTFYVFGFLFVQKANTVFVVLGSNNIFNK